MTWRRAQQKIQHLHVEVVVIKPFVEMVSYQIMGEMVLDGGGHFIPAGIDGFHTLSLLLAFLVAHDRATEDIHTIQERDTSTREERLVH